MSLTKLQSNIYLCNILESLNCWVKESKEKWFEFVFLFFFFKKKGNYLLPLPLTPLHPLPSCFPVLASTLWIFLLRNSSFCLKFSLLLFREYGFEGNSLLRKMFILLFREVVAFRDDAIETKPFVI